jgi:hypothetical protein
MSSIEFKEITSTEETKLFLDKFENYTGVRLPTAYAKKSKVVGVFSQGRLSAGYMLVTEPGFRSTMFVPDATKAQSPFFKNDEYDMMEVNGLWIGPAIKTPQLQFKIWLRMVMDIFMAKKKFLLLMCDSRNENIKKLHNLTNPDFIYEGSPNTMAGENSVGSVRVAYTTRWKMIMGIPRYIKQLKIREKRVVAATARRTLARG